MDYRFTASDDDFRKQVRAFFERELPDWWHEVEDVREDPEIYEVSQTIKKRLGAQGWLAMAWPKEYGGAGAMILQQMIYAEEAAYHHAPTGGLGVITVGPAILLHGSDEQKQKYLTQIARGEADFCVLYSEPHAGSDLAALSTSAVRDGGDYVINGEKIFTGGGDKARFGWLAARTDPEAPKHRGISLFVVDMSTPGVRLEPMESMAGYSSYFRTYFDNVRIPKENLVGEENRGWYQLAVSLDFERSGVSRVAYAQRVLQDLVAYAQSTYRNGQLLAKDPVVRAKLAQAAIEIDVARYMAYRVGSLQQQGKPFGHEASSAKVFGTDLSQRIHELAMELLGPYGLLRKGSARAVFNGRYGFEYLNSWAGVFGAGTGEIQRSIIAQRRLGLPRDRE